jgi:hypothetical protein
MNRNPGPDPRRASARRIRRTRPLEPAEELRTALQSRLGPTERMDLVATAVGCSLVLTDRRLVLVRDGAHYRPKSGVQSWPVDRELDLRLEPARRGTSRLRIERDAGSASVFITEPQIGSISSLIAEVRRRTHGI